VTHPPPVGGSKNSNEVRSFSGRGKRETSAHNRDACACRHRSPLPERAAARSTLPQGEGIPDGKPRNRKQLSPRLRAGTSPTPDCDNPESGLIPAPAPRPQNGRLNRRRRDARAPPVTREPNRETCHESGPFAPRPETGEKFFRPAAPPLVRVARPHRLYSRCGNRVATGLVPAPGDKQIKTVPARAPVNPRRAVNLSSPSGDKNAVCDS